MATPTDNGEVATPRGVAKQEDEELLFSELGATGLKRQAGRIDEEFLPELKGETGVRTLTEMADNDGVVGAILFALEMVLRSVEWATIPGGTDAVDAEAADFLASNLEDMSNTWTEFVGESTSFIKFGWSFHETVWKRRQGVNPRPLITDPDAMERPLDPTPRDSATVHVEEPASSKFDDNRIGIRKLPIRGQESLDRWLFDQSGGIRGMTQRPAPDYDLRAIPIEKALLFRTTAAKGNPEGRSALRNAYRPWYFKRSIQEIEAIGIERDLAGLPAAGIPARFFKASASTEEKRALAKWEQTMRDIRVDSLQGLVYPLEYDSNSNPLYKVELLTTGGARAIDTDPVIQRYNVEIATVVLADFILLGHEKVGSFALASQKSDLFSVAINGWLMSMADVLNRHLVPRLFERNDFNLEKLPQLVPTALGRVDLKELGQYITDLAGVGYNLFPNAALESALLQVAELPEPSEDEREETPDEEDLPEAPELEEQDA